MDYVDRNDLAEALVGAYLDSPPIVRVAVLALLEFENTIDMGYDLSFYQEDLPKAVARAIAPWRNTDSTTSEALH